MAIRRLDVQTEWIPFWNALDLKLRKHAAKKKGWLARKLHNIYDMGENLNLILEWKLRKKDVNWLNLPGRENCVGLGSSAYGAGFDAIRTVVRNWPQLYIFEDMPHVHETADGAPGHYGWSEKFRRLQPGEPIRAGCSILCMSWSDPEAKDIDELLGRTGKIFLLIKIPLLFVASLWNDLSGIFKDGIKITQRDYFEIPYPYWKATHYKLVQRNDNGILKIVEQQAFFKETAVHQAEIYAEMQGETPKYIVLEPKFLYG